MDTPKDLDFVRGVMQEKLERGEINAVSIQILDCTLRDGGYINDWAIRPKDHRVHPWISWRNANIDIIECGFLTGMVEDEDCSLFNQHRSDLEAVLPKQERNSMYVAMIAIGERKNCIPLKLVPYDGKSIGGNPPDLP